MIFPQTSEISYLFMRLATGGFLLPHGLDKLGHWEKTLHFFTAVCHVPVIFAYLVTIMEVLGGLAIVLGLFVRPVAAVVVVFMVNAAFFRAAHGHYFWNQGGYEMPLFWGSMAISLVIGGAGKLCPFGRLVLDKIFPWLR